MNYAFYLTMNEVLELIVFHCERARHAECDPEMGVHLKMASRAMRCALEIYGSHLGVQKEEVK